MDVRFLTPFLKAAVEVLSSELGVPVERGEIFAQKSACTTDEVNVVLTLVGRLQGVVVYGMAEETALAIVTRILGQNFRQMDDLAQSGVAELGNVITGRASTLLAEAGYHTALSVPMLIVGQVTVSMLDLPRVVVPLLTRYGQVKVHLALREVLSAKTGSGGPR